MAVSSPLSGLTWSSLTKGRVVYAFPWDECFGQKPFVGVHAGADSGGALGHRPPCGGVIFGALSQQHEVL
jgi:hypothetical protein